MRSWLRFVAIETLARLQGPPPRTGIRFLAGHSLAGRDIARFDDLLRSLKKNWTFINFGDAVALRRSGKVDGRYVCFSFDDGLWDVAETIIPCLERHHVNACVFVLTDLLDGDLSTRQAILQREIRASPCQLTIDWSGVLRLRDAGAIIGCHGSSHRNLSALPLQEAIDDVLLAKSRLEDRLGHSCDYFAWPFGSSRHCSTQLAAQVRPHFLEIFSTIRNPTASDERCGCIHRDNFEPWWSPRHVEYFLRRRRE